MSPDGKIHSPLTSSQVEPGTSCGGWTYLPVALSRIYPLGVPGGITDGSVPAGAT